MEQSLQPRRCPKCNALVVDRRSPVCTTCREELPKDWVMTQEQASAVMLQDARAQALHKQEMRVLDPRLDPNVPGFVKFLNQNGGVAM